MFGAAILLVVEARTNLRRLKRRHAGFFRLLFAATISSFAISVIALVR